VTSTDPLETLRRRAYRAALEDGVADVVIGLFTLIFGVATQRRGFLALAVVYMITCKSAWRFVHRDFVSRRVGYAEFPENPPAVQLVWTLAAGVISLCVVAVVTLSKGRVWNLARWPDWLPMLAGLVLAAGFLHPAARSGLVRYYAYVVAAIAGSVFFWLFPLGPSINPSDRLTLFLFSVSGLIIGTGVAAIIRFARAHPVLTLEARDGR
jgi:hypothetical protein